MNIFFVIKNSVTEREELITPSLTRGDVLPGVTRRSVIEITQKWGDIDVHEIDLSIDDVSIASRSGRLVEAFATGTAAVITPISCIEYGRLNMNIPATGKLTRKLFQSLVDIQYGNILHEWSVTVD
jgi:branched-chain amino acid aminotransferase